MAGERFMYLPWQERFEPVIWPRPDYPPGLYLPFRLDGLQRQRVMVGGDH